MRLDDKLVVSRPLYLGDTHCGYCHQKKPRSQAVSLESWLKRCKDGFFPESITTGFDVKGMTVEQYDKMVQLGYRRSGTFLYKPDLLRTCCRMYTIRTSWDNLVPQKEHRRDVNKFNSHLSVSKKDTTKKPGSFDMEMELNRCLEAGVFELRFEKSEFSKEKYDLFVKYQAEIHDDTKTTRRGFTRFLCDTPFRTDGEISSDGTIESYGAIHQCYYLNSKLIAVAFLDVLPSGLSSVYFIYDPEYKNLTLGKISGLREMLLTRTLGLKWYYLGYYIDDCPKMSYKRKFGAEILNPLDRKFYPYDLLSRGLESGRLFSWDPQAKKDVAEERFGVEGKEFEETEKYVDLVRKRWKVGYSNTRWDQVSKESEEKDRESDEDEEEDGDENEPDIFDIPVVLAGCLSLKDVTDNPTRLENTKLRVLQGSLPLEVPFKNLIPRFQKTVIDLIRLLGWELYEECVVYM